MKRNVVLIAFCFVAIMANAFSLSGNVKTEAMKALPFASVYVKDARIGATTDLDGNYTIRDIPSGHHTLVVSFMGYATQTIDISLEENGVRNFVMREQAITLDEVFVTPTGESIERFILSQAVKNSKKLSKRVSNFSCNESFQYEQRNNNIKVLVEPHIKTINLLLGVLGYKRFFHTIIDHPDLKVAMTTGIQFKKGKLKVNNPKITHSNPALNDEETKSWMKIISKQSEIPYDVHYRNLADIKKKLEKMDKKSPGESARHLTYKGAYKENNKTIHIIQYDKRQFHIVDGCWQIRRTMLMKNKKEASRITEFHELAKNLYMPVSHYFENSFGLKDFMEDKLDEMKKEDTSKMSSKKLAKHNSRVQSLQDAITDDADVFKFSLTYNYVGLHR